MSKRYSQVRWIVYISMSLILHASVALLTIVIQKDTVILEESKVTWITLPSTSNSGSGGGSNSINNGGDIERQHRIDDIGSQHKEVAKPKLTPNLPNNKLSKSSHNVNNSLDSKSSKPNKLTLANKLTVTNKPTKPTAANKLAATNKPTVASSILSTQHTKPTIGTAGTGSQGGVGISTGSSVSNSKSANGVQGGGIYVANLDNNFPFAWYIQQIQTRITSNWNRLNLANGRVEIYFRIKRNGSIEGIRIESPSGNASLDHMALLAVRRSDPLPRLPDGFNFDYLGVRFWFTYLK